jgi:hypothetical protein
VELGESCRNQRGLCDARSMKAYVNQKVTGVEQPQPIPGTELLNQRREAAEAAARAPSETRGIHLRIGRTI